MTEFHHVDVFASAGYTGNSLAVFVDPPPLAAGQMAQITRELRHFETIFVTPQTAPETVRARVFDLLEELDFAGHPVLGAAAVLHELRGVPVDEEFRWTFMLNARTVLVTTRRRAGGPVSALMDQGRPDWTATSVRPDRVRLAAALGLRAADLHGKLPLEVVSTGLRYLIVPVRGGALARAHITHPDLAGLLGVLGAQFAYLLDPEALEGRHWNNDGVVEDVATGSAAGCVAAYLLKHGRIRDGEKVGLSQGRFTGRPSTLAVTAFGSPRAVQRVTVGGEVTIVATGSLRTLPPREPA